MTGKTVLISDIRAEIEPYKILDLERITRSQDIHRSGDLKACLKGKMLQLVRQTVVRISPDIVPDKTPKVPITESRLKDIIREVVSEQTKTEVIVQQKPVTEPQQDIEQSVSNAVTKSVAPLIEQLRDRLANLPIGGQTVKESQQIETEIDATKLAEMQQKSISSVSKEIDTKQVKPGKKIKIINSKSVSDLADEL